MTLRMIRRMKLETIRPAKKRAPQLRSPTTPEKRRSSLAPCSAATPASTAPPEFQRRRRRPKRNDLGFRATKPLGGAALQRCDKEFAFQKGSSPESISSSYNVPATFRAACRKI